MRYAVERGDRHGDLFFIEGIEKRGRENRVMSLWECVCGAPVLAATSRVISGYKSSCGCVGKELARSAVTKHGMKGSKEYNSWGSIKDRCLNPTSKDFHRYGAKGIDVYPAWAESFTEFFAYIGPAPGKAHQVDRIDNRLGYMPGNVRWATPKEQCMNRRNSKRWFVKGLVFESITDAAAHFGVAAQTIHKWCNGYLDNRGTHYPKKDDCHADLKY